MERKTDFHFSASRHSVMDRDDLPGDAVKHWGTLGYACLVMPAAPAWSKTPDPFPPKSPYFEALRERCPAQHLEYLNPGILTDGIEAFREALAPGLRIRLEHDAKPYLEKCEAGAGCVNRAYIRASQQLKLSAKLVEEVCNLPYTCRAPFDCQGP